MPIEDRIITLNTPLGKSTHETLVFESMTATEELGRMFNISLNAVSSDPNIDHMALLGKTVSVSIETQSGGMRHLHGHVINFGLVGISSGHFQYHMTVQPWTSFLTRRSNNRIFQIQSIQDILRTIFDECPESPKYRFELSMQHPTWEYCVQYRETDFNFVSRLMEEHGIYYYFVHTEANHTMVITDSIDSHPPCPNGYDTVPLVMQSSDSAALDTEYIADWHLTNSIQPEKATVRDYNFAKAKQQLHNESTAPIFTHGGSKEFYDYPSSFQVAGFGPHETRLRLEELQARRMRVTASGTARGILCGHVFHLYDHPRDDQNIKHLVLGTHLSCRAASMEAGAGGGTSIQTSFTAAPANMPFRPARTTPKSHVAGPQTAVVVGPVGEEIHCDEFGRVKVKFHWDREEKEHPQNHSCWVRVSHPWAGKGWGAISIPRIGQEVIVDFLEGDPDQPIITGRVYNSDQTAPFDLPAKKMVSGIKSNTHKGTGYNELTMDDTAGNELINTHAQYNMTTVVEHDDSQTIRNDRTIKVDGTHTETITKDTKITIKSGTYNHDVAGNTATYHVSADLTENYDANQTSTIGSNRTASVGSNDKLSIGSNQEVSVGANVKVSAGANAEYAVGAQHKLTIGATSETSAGASYKISVGAAVIEMTPASIKISCGGASIELTPASVAVTAPTVSLNG
jgi:type VI secretion system secreted protein VgrG